MSALRRLEWRNLCEILQHTRKGEQMRKYNERTGSEGSRYGTRDQAGITEYPDRVVWLAGDGTLSAIEGECGCGISTGD